MKKFISWLKSLLKLNKTVTEKVLEEASKPVKKGTGSSKGSISKSGVSKTTVTKKVLKEAPKSVKKGTGSSKGTVSKRGRKPKNK